jgi:hypothetical protein
MSYSDETTMTMTRIKRPLLRKSLHSKIFIVPILSLIAITVIGWHFATLQQLDHAEVKLHPISLLTADPRNVFITTDVRGNLGPPEVMLNNGTDWIKDRWQAASDMHGTAIKGSHWVNFEFMGIVTLSTVVLDWEAAYSDDYKLEARLDDKEEYTTLFDSKTGSDRFTVSETGQSPGVKTKTPLHVVHTISIKDNTKNLRQFRIWIRSSAMGWGVSLWQVQLYGQSNYDRAK